MEVESAVELSEEEYNKILPFFIGDSEHIIKKDYYYSRYKWSFIRKLCGEPLIRVRITHSSVICTIKKKFTKDDYEYNQEEKWPVENFGRITLFLKMLSYKIYEKREKDILSYFGTVYVSKHGFPILVHYELERINNSCLYLKTTCFQDVPFIIARQAVLQAANQLGTFTRNNNLKILERT